MSKTARTRQKNRTIPRLRPLRYQRDQGPVYCELCKRVIKVGDRFAWWGIDGRRTAYCIDCHRLNVREGRALR